MKIVLSQSVFSYKSSSWPQAANWSEIDDFLAEVNGKDRRAAGEFLEAFCHGYLVTQKGVKDQFANVWPSRGVPETVRDSLNLNKTDIGVDLVAQFHDGRFATIQCKYTSINEKKTLNWTSDRISSWLAASSNAEALLLFTNAESLDPYSRLKANEKDFRIVNEGHLSALTSDEISAILSFIQSTSHSQINQSSPQVTPRPYQIDAISQVLTGFQNASRGKLILPCGAGKTLTAKWIKDRLEPRLTLVLVPSLALLAQFRWSWSDHAERDENYFCVCSEKDIAAGRDESGIEIEEIGTRVTTDPHLIRTLIQHAKTDLVIYSTYQSSPRIAEALSGTGIVFDLAICDEAHRTAGSKTGSFATVHAEAIPIKKRLYMTATPRIVAKILKEKLGPRYQYLADMNDESIYGPEFYRMSFSEAIELEILVDYQIVVIGVSDSEVQNAIARRRWVLEDATAEAIAQNFALHKAMQTYGFTHAVTFHNSIANAKNFTARHEKYFSEASAYHINGTFSSTERAKLLNRFAASSKASISNSRCLTEGVDLPAIDAVMFCDPKTSKTDIVQAAGRALRKDKNKPSKVGYIVVPVFHRNEETVDSAIENGIFGHLISIVRALADHDSRLEDEITQISLGLGKRRQPQSRIVITEGAPKILEIQGFTDKLKKAVFSQIIEKTVIPWLVQIEHLKAYRKRFPDKWPSATQCYPKGNNLGGWVNKVRNDFKKSKLEAEKIAALDSLNFVWESDFDRRNRLAAEEKQKQFIKLEADRLLKEQLAEEKRMLREAAAELERESDRQSMLKLQAEREERDWQIHFGRLESYRRNAVVKTAEPLNYYRNDETVDLTAWLALQRKLFNEKKLSPDRASCLEELGFPLSPTKEQYEHAAKSERLEQIEQLRRFRIENPLEKWITSTFEYPLSNLLGKFVAETRKEHRLKLVDSATLAVFSELGFELNYSYENELIRRRDAKNGDWNQQFKILKKFIEEDPRRPFPSGSVEYPIGNPLGKWCSRQRQKNTILTADQRKLLESINFNFVRDAASDDPRLWDYHIREIRKAIGNTQIEASAAERCISMWVEKQKRPFLHAELTRDQVQKLKLLKVNYYDDKVRVEWRKNFEKALAESKYWTSETSFPERYLYSHDWCQLQLALADKNCLPIDLVVQLRELKLVRPQAPSKIDSFISLAKKQSKLQGQEFFPINKEFSKFRATQLLDYSAGKIGKLKLRILDLYGFNLTEQLESKAHRQWLWQYELLSKLSSEGKAVPKSAQSRGQCGVPRNNIFRWYWVQLAKQRAQLLTSEQEGLLSALTVGGIDIAASPFKCADWEKSRVNLAAENGDYWFLTASDESISRLVRVGDQRARAKTRKNALR